MESLIDCLAEWALRTPDKVFARYRTDSGEDGLTYAHLAQAVTAQAARLAALGVRPGDRVPLVMDNTLDAMIVFLAVMRAGGVPCFMPFPNPKQDLGIFHATHAPVFARLDARIVVVDDRIGAPDGYPAVRLSALAEGQADEAALPSLPDGDAVALLQHSSGTTGLKKGVALSHRAILAQIAAYGEAIGFGADDHVATWLPLYHDMGLITSFLMPLAKGASVVSVSPFRWVARPWLLLQAIAETKATFCWLPNFAFAHLARTRPSGSSWDLSGVRALISCSEPARAETFAAFLQRFADCGIRAEQLRVCYALAENVFAATQTDAYPQAVPSPAGAGWVVECGRPIAGVDVRIADPDRDGVGEIWLHSPFLFDGYFREPDLTADRMSGAWYRTGDTGFLADGRLYVTGRKDDRIIVYGRNIHAYDIEAIVHDVAGVIPGRCVALGLYQPALGTSEIVVVAEVDRPDQGDAIRRAIRETVQARTGIMPRRVLAVEKGWLVKTTSGKVSRSENLKKYRQLMESADE